MSSIRLDTHLISGRRVISVRPDSPALLSRPAGKRAIPGRCSVFAPVRAAGVALLLFLFAHGGRSIFAAEFFTVDFESGMGPLVDPDEVYSLGPGQSLSSTVAYRADLSPGLPSDRKFLMTSDEESNYNQIGASNVDFVFEVLLNNDGEGISFVGLGSDVIGDGAVGYSPINSIFLRILDSTVQFVFQDESSGGALKLIESAPLSVESSEYQARIVKQGPLLSFHLDEDNDGVFDWNSTTTIDISVEPSGGSGANDYRFLQDADSGHLFVGTGWHEREFDNVRVYLPGDMNGDGGVGEADVNPMVLALTNRTLYEATYPNLDVTLTGDLNGDGSLNLGDLGMFSALVAAASDSSANGGSANGAVPEPATSSLSLMALLFASFFASRRRK